MYRDLVKQLILTAVFQSELSCDFNDDFCDFDYDTSSQYLRWMKMLNDSDSFNTGMSLGVF